MADGNVGSVVVNAAYEDGRPHEGGATQFGEVGLLVVKAEDFHIWLEGTHFVGDGVADTVREGDLFYKSVPATTVFKVTKIDESVPTSGRGVTIEYLFSPHSDVSTDGVSLDLLRGEMEEGTMGDPGPPTKLRKYH